MLSKVNVIEIHSDTRDTGMLQVGSHPSLDKRVFREHNGGLEWAYLSEWQERGWASRTYGSVFKVEHLEVIG